VIISEFFTDQSSVLTEEGFSLWLLDSSGNILAEAPDNTMEFRSYFLDSAEEADKLFYDVNNGGNSPFSKEDMKNKKCPCLIIKKLSKNDWGIDYSNYLGSEQEDVLKIYFGDKLEKLEEKFYNFGVGFLERI
jgi:hypothetical protein